MGFLGKAFFLSVAVALGLGLVSSVSAGNVLFIGNSFIHGADPKLREHGGVPAVFEAIALAKGKETQATMVAVSGKDWTFHLTSAETAAAISSKVWDQVVIQDYSTRPTHLGDREEFLRDGEALANLIWAASPQAEIILYRTWARKPGHDFYQEGENPPPFRDFNAMDVELGASYQALLAILTGKNPDKSVRIAHVGDAIATCLRQHPETDLYSPDLYHLNPLGSYLAALLCYTTVFQESPAGAIREFPTFSVEEAVATQLQETADELR